MKTFLICLVLPAMFLFTAYSACHSDSETVEEDEDFEMIDVIQTGIASWYGPGFHGRLTSNREVFDQYDYTAAHRTLPFNTILKVVNLENDKSVEVRINDRGPFTDHGIIDLSKAAAKEIDLIDSGIAEVELTLIEAGGPLPEKIDRPVYTIQVGEYNLVSYAESFADSVGDGVRIEQRVLSGGNRTVYMIYYGNYDSFRSAREDLKELKNDGFDGLIKQIN